MAENAGAADDCRKLLDNNKMIVLYRNGLGSYTSVCLMGPMAIKVQKVVNKLPDDSRFVTDDFTPSKSLHRLTEKVTTGRVVGTDKNWEDRPK